MTNLHNLISLLKLELEESRGKDPEKALREIEQIMSLLDEVKGPCESAMRILLFRVKRPKLSDIPEWWNSELAELHRDESYFATAALEQASLLVRSVLTHLPSMSARLASGYNGSVEVVWNISPYLSWYVYPSFLPWPGVRVRVYSRDERENLTAKSLFLAETVTSHAVAHLGIEYPNKSDGGEGDI